MNLKSRLATYAVTGIFTLSNLAGCSAYVKKDNFPVGTSVYAIPKNEADSKIEYVNPEDKYLGTDTRDSLSVRELAGKDGVDAVYMTDIFGVKKTLAKRLDLPDKKQGFWTKIIGETNDIKKDTKNTIKTKQKQSEKTNPNAWYTNKWVKTGGAVIVGGLIWYIYDQNNKSSDKKQDVETIWIPGDEGRTGGSRQEDRTGGSKQ